MKILFNGRELELWQGACGSDLLSPEEQARVEAGDLALWEEHDGWMGLGGALRNNGRYSLLDAKVARLRLLPSVDRILAHPALAGLTHSRIVDASRSQLTDLRERILHDEKIIPQLESIVESILSATKTVAADENQAMLPAWLNPRVLILADPCQSLCNELRRIAPGGILALPRQHLAESTGKRVEDTIRQAGWLAMPLGTINRCKYADFQQAVNAGVGAIAFLTPDAYSLEGFVTNVKPKQLAELALAEDIPFLYYRGNTGLSIA